MLMESKAHGIDSEYLRKCHQFIEYLERSSKKKLSYELLEKLKQIDFYKFENIVIT